MAMAGRIRSSLPLVNRLLSRVDSLSPHSHRSTLHPSILFPQLSNNYATASSKKEEKVKVPLHLFGGAGNYATALYVAAVKGNALDKVESEIVDLVEASKRSQLFSQFTKDLSVPEATSIKSINDICAQAKFSDLTKNFLVLLAQNGRLRHLESIAEKFVKLTKARRGEVNAIVTSIMPLPPNEEKELKEALEELLGQGKQVKLEQKIDESILGGLVIELDQKVLDLSIKTRAERMEKLLREPIDLDSLWKML